MCNCMFSNLYIHAFIYIHTLYMSYEKDIYMRWSRLKAGCVKDDPKPHGTINPLDSLHRWTYHKASKNFPPSTSCLSDWRRSFAIQGMIQKWWTSKRHEHSFFLARDFMALDLALISTDFVIVVLSYKFLLFCWSRFPIRSMRNRWLTWKSPGNWAVVSFTHISNGHPQNWGRWNPFRIISFNWVAQPVPNCPYCRGPWKAVNIFSEPRVKLKILRFLL